MSNKKKKKTYTSYKDIKTQKESEKQQSANAKKTSRFLMIKQLISYVLLLAIIILVMLKIDGRLDYAHKIYMPLTGIVMILLTYKDPNLATKFKNPKHNRILVTSLYAIGVLELIFSVYLIFFQ
ncbi:MAG: hypothetical protein MJ171_04535 [Clostridia bacterium]|nr:hypothetical protein [Clostridia bacterium]